MEQANVSRQRQDLLFGPELQVEKDYGQDSEDKSDHLQGAHLFFEECDRRYKYDHYTACRDDREHDRSRKRAVVKKHHITAGCIG